MSSLKLYMAFILLAAVFINNGFAASEFVVDGLPPIYREIIDEYQHTYEEIGRTKALAVLDSNGKLQVKGLNHLGFTYAKDFAAFSIDVKRDVQPDLFHDTRFIVTDEIIITISAAKLFGDLSEQALAELDGIKKGAFAGIKFVRIHRNVHFAASFSAAMTSSYKYLFMGFMPFYNSNIDWETDNVLSSREDYFSVKAGGMVVAPITGYLSAAVGILGKYERVSKSTLEFYEKDETRRVRLSYEKSKTLSLGVNAALYLGFANILKLTLLSYDFNYSLKESMKYNLDFEQENLADRELEKQVNRILRGKKPNIDYIAPFILSIEERKAKMKSSKFRFLLWTKEVDEKTEQIKIVRDNVEKNFYRHQYSNISGRDGIWSTLLSAIIGTQLGQGMRPNKKKWHKKTMNLEYASERNLIVHPDDQSIPHKEEISVKFGFELNATKKTKKLMRLLAHNTAFRDDLLDLMDNNGLEPPYFLKGHTQLGEEAIEEFAEKNVSTTHEIVQYLCSEKGWKKGFCERRVWSPYEKYVIAQKRAQHSGKKIKKGLKKCRRRKWFMARFFNLFRSAAKRSGKMQSCLEKLDKKYVTSSKSVKSTSLDPMKSFFQRYYNYADNKLDIYYLFGTRNIFNHGSFTAQTANKDPVTIYYKQGKFQGLGAVENYRQILTPSRVPASVLVEN